MLAWKLIFFIFVFFQALSNINCLAVRQIGVSESVNPWSLLTAAITQLPRAILGASVDVTSNSAQDNSANAVSRIPTIDIGVAGNGQTSIGNGGQGTLGSSGINVLRRGIGYVEDSVISALSRMASLIGSLDGVTQDGNVYAGNLSTSAQQLLRRLLNSSYSVIDNVAQDITQQASLTPSSTFNYRPARFFASNARLNDGGRLFAANGEEIVGFNGNVAGSGRAVGGLSVDVRQQPQASGELGSVTFRPNDSQLQPPTVVGEFGLGGGRQFSGSETDADEFEMRERQLKDDSEFGLNFSEAGHELETLLNSPNGLASLIQMFLQPFGNISANNTLTDTENMRQSGSFLVSSADSVFNANSNSTSTLSTAQEVSPTNDISASDASSEEVPFFSQT